VKVNDLVVAPSAVRTTKPVSNVVAAAVSCVTVETLVLVTYVRALRVDEEGSAPRQEHAVGICAGWRNARSDEACEILHAEAEAKVGSAEV